MASQIQMVMYEGFLADDPELRYLDGGTGVTNFRIGSNREYTKKDGTKVKETTWLRVTAWGKLAEIVNQWCGKGSHVIVTGTLRGGENGSPAVYELKSGGHGASFELNAEQVRILKGKDGSTSQVVSATDDDIPF